jgi:hypothetical protein
MRWCSCYATCYIYCVLWVSSRVGQQDLPSLFCLGTAQCFCKHVCFRCIPAPVSKILYTSMTTLLFLSRGMTFVSLQAWGHTLSKSNQMLFVTYTCLADVISGVAECLCFNFGWENAKSVQNCHQGKGWLLWRISNIKYILICLTPFWLLQDSICAIS